MVRRGAEVLLPNCLLGCTRLHKNNNSFWASIRVACSEGYVDDINGLVVLLTVLSTYPPAEPEPDRLTLIIRVLILPSNLPQIRDRNGIFAPRNLSQRRYILDL
jgi:hypothetical protein